MIVELKAVSAHEDAHRSQVYNYLHATGLTLGLLLRSAPPLGLYCKEPGALSALIRVICVICATIRTHTDIIRNIREIRVLVYLFK